MRDGVEHLEAALRQFGCRSLARPEPNSRILVHDHHGLRRLAGGVVELDQIVERGLGDDAEAGREAESVLQPAR